MESVLGLVGWKSAVVVLVVVLIGIALAIAFVLRRVVPTNMVHIVQSSKTTTPYGRGKEAGNTYYAFPSWLPIWGVSVIEFPESIFQVSLSEYEAYDSARLPFLVDVTAFFRVDQAEVAAQRIPSFKELHQQLQAVLQGAVRRILAINKLEKIMEDRSTLGSEFTDEVEEQIKEWGVFPVKTIEFMDIKDTKNTRVIAEIMAKEMSRINMESRSKVAENNRAAEMVEIDATRTVEVNKQDAEQQVGLRTAEKDKSVGIANEQAKQEVAEQAKTTAEKTMAVERVKQEVEAQINKQVSITHAEAAKATNVLTAEGEAAAVVHRAEGDLQKTLKEAEGKLAEGQAVAKAQELLLQAPVTAQITLAKEIGSNEGYQTYLVSIEQVRASQEVGVQMAKALEKADLKIISTGANKEGVLPGVAGLADLFTVDGGTKLTGMLSSLAATEEGKALISRFTKQSSEAEQVEQVDPIAA